MQELNYVGTRHGFDEPCYSDDEEENADIDDHPPTASDDTSLDDLGGHPAFQDCELPLDIQRVLSFVTRRCPAMEDLLLRFTNYQDESAINGRLLFLLTPVTWSHSLRKLDIDRLCGSKDDVACFFNKLGALEDLRITEEMGHPLDMSGVNPLALRRLRGFCGSPKSAQQLLSHCPRLETLRCGWFFQMREYSI